MMLAQLSPQLTPMLLFTFKVVEAKRGVLVVVVVVLTPATVYVVHSKYFSLLNKLPAFKTIKQILNVEANNVGACSTVAHH